MKKVNKFLAAGMAAFFVGASVPVDVNVTSHGTKVTVEVKRTTASAAKYDLGYDWASYQGQFGATSGVGAKFAFSKIGGDGTSYFSPVYKSQVEAGIARGLRMHTYGWFQDITTYEQADAWLTKYLPQLQTPKGSIFALDVEAGQINNDVIIYAMHKIKDAGYTPMFYSYKPFIESRGVDIDRIGREFGNTAVWIAGYGLNQVGAAPDYNYFPSMNNVGIWQYSSMGLPTGLDMNVDLSGDANWSLTENGYKNGNVEKPNTDTPSVDAGNAANDTAKSDIKVGDAVKVKFSADSWATGQGIPGYIKGQTYTVQQVSGDRLLLSGVMSWINRADVEIISVGASAGSTYTVQYGDSWWAIANKYGMSMYTLAANNGKTINSMIHPGDVLNVSGSSQATSNSYVVKSGDSFWSIGQKFGLNMYDLAAKNGLSINTVIHPGDVLVY